MVFCLSWRPCASSGRRSLQECDQSSPHLQYTRDPRGRKKDIFYIHENSEKRAGRRKTKEMLVRATAEANRKARRKKQRKKQRKKHRETRTHDQTTGILRPHGATANPHPLLVSVTFLQHWPFGRRCSGGGDRRKAHLGGVSCGKGRVQKGEDLLKLSAPQSYAGSAEAAAGPAELAELAARSLAAVAAPLPQVPFQQLTQPASPRPEHEPGGQSLPRVWPYGPQPGGPPPPECSKPLS